MFIDTALAEVTEYLVEVVITTNTILELLATWRLTPGYCTTPLPTTLQLTVGVALRLNQIDMVIPDVQWSRLVQHSVPDPGRKTLPPSWRYKALPLIPETWSESTIPDAVPIILSP